MVFKRKSKKKSRKRSSGPRKKAEKRKQFKGKRKTKSKNMAKKKGGFRRAASKVSNSLKSGMLGDAIKGAGAQSLSREVTDRMPVSPTVKTAVAVGAAYMAGGVVGAVVAALKEGLVGQFGGGGNPGGSMEAI